MSARSVMEFTIEELTDLTPAVRKLVLKRKKSSDDQSVFRFKAGQFAMLHVPSETPGSKPQLRAYSIASSDRVTDKFTLLFKYVENGVASKYIWNLNGSEILSFTGPFGRVFFQEPPPERVLFLNTGTGLSQHLCYIESKLDLFPKLKAHILIGQRKEIDIYYQPELDQLKSQFPNLSYEFVLSRPSPSWTGKKGYVQDFIKDCVKDKADQTAFYLCGNNGMIEQAKTLLAGLGVQPESIYSEAFDKAAK